LDARFSLASPKPDFQQLAEFNRGGVVIPDAVIYP